MNHALTRQEILAKRLASIDSAAEYAECSERTIRRRVADGTLTGFRFGPRLLRVDLNELDAALHRVPAASTEGRQG